ncbi:hypothetical protein ACRFAY_09425 [Bacteroides hominis]|uniref:hypothetical protein n=1 Tax=Bacteroides TaxID=816 RepID=UPI000C78574C|nr:MULTISPECIES: hypothetical protein [Bacteroides]AUI45848.1 hypothetical protein BUN20_04025 [Bacteroides fragilis]MCC2236266.1 hypothetical protein [Bacteroides hominis (ex Afrizal et al. 2022)]MCE8625733.1 hypothetical protein [Bacteroides fragilis]MCE8700696.1 hypothetical protein [Bacteroides fragilis]MCE8706486.1 hypothetical protein [Bacteroides fragilis]
MKKIYLLLSFLSAFFLLSACSDDTEQCLYSPEVFDTGNLLSNKVKEEFLNFDYPAGIVPVLFAADSIEPIKMGAYADECFDALVDSISESKDFKRRGMLVLVSRNPELIQIRLGSRYRVYCNMTGATSGVDYLNLQKQIREKGIEETLPLFLQNTSVRIQELNALPSYKKYRINSAVSAISTCLEYIGTPSENFYGKCVLTPILKTTSLGYYVFKSWLLTFMFVCLIMLLCRWALFLVVKRLLQKHVIGLIWSQKIINWGLRLLFSISAAASAIILSSGRMEDAIALQAIGVPFIENFQIAAADYVLKTSFVAAFFFVLMYALKRNIVSDIFLYSLLEPEKQQAIYHNLSDAQKTTLVIGHEADLSKVEESSEPYSELFTSRVSQRETMTIVSLAMAALFLIPRPLIIMGIALTIYPLAGQCVKIYHVVSNNTLPEQIKKDRRTSLITNLLIIFIIAFITVLMGLFFNPMPDKKEIDLNEARTELVTSDRLEGNYTVSKSIAGQVQVSSGIIKKIKNGAFQLLITGKSSPKVYKLGFDSDEMIFVSEELGNGIIHYDKDLDKIKVVFTINEHTTWTISK